MFEPNQIICGDCVKDGIMRRFPDNSFDGIVTDPPYGLGFMGKDWDTFAEAKATRKEGHYITKAADGSPVRHQKGFSAASAAGQYDHSRNAEFQQWFTVWAAEALRIVKPGAIMLIFGGTRTYHRLTCAIEDAGWQIRDCMMWIYGSGFPKSTSISQQFDKVACREQLEKELGRKSTKEELKKAWERFRKTQKLQKTDIYGDYEELNIKERGDVQTAKAKGVGYLADPANRNNEKCFGYGIENITVPTTPLAKLWDGYGTALKPAWEPIVVAMKPLDGTFAANAEKWGVAGLNIDGGRIGTNDNLDGGAYAKNGGRSSLDGDQREGVAQGMFQSGKTAEQNFTQPQGRWPANLILDEEAAAMLDEQSGVLTSGKLVGKYKGSSGKTACYGEYGFAEKNYEKHSGGASRFFYCPKASRAERNAGLDCDPQITDDGRKKKIDNAYLRGKTLRQNNHPTVKPLALMEYLCTLLKPPTEHPILLDPFCGSGTTLMAAVNTGWDYVGIEKEKEYCEIAEKRVTYTKKQRQGQMALWKGD